VSWARLRQRTLLVPSGLSLGTEKASAAFVDAPSYNPSKWGHSNTMLRIPSLSVDKYVRRHNISRVHLLSIDTEGFDALVLEGARSSLGGHNGVRVDVVEFEFNPMAFWNPLNPERRLLRDAVAWLHGVGYSCFWQGNRGCLAPASGNCWRKKFGLFGAHIPSLPPPMRWSVGGTHSWTNLVCASNVTDAHSVLWSLSARAANAPECTQAHRNAHSSKS
jgi:hypothetical protein